MSRISDSKKVFNPAQRKWAVRVIKTIRAKVTAKSYDKHMCTCTYRGPAGLRCAVGVFIPNTRYSPDFEGVGLSCVTHNDVPGHRDTKMAKRIIRAVFGHSVPVSDPRVRFLAECQWAHDDCTARSVDYSQVISGPAWRNEFSFMLDELCKDWGLEECVVGKDSEGTVKS